MVSEQRCLVVSDSQEDELAVDGDSGFQCVTSSKKDAAVLCETDDVSKLHEPSIICPNIGQ